MLSRNPDERPTTYGIRASTPLRIYQVKSVLCYETFKMLNTFILSWIQQ